MPELPEVETIRRLLKSSLTHQTIQKVKILDASCLDGIPSRRNVNVDDFCQQLLGLTIKDIIRRGKCLGIVLNQNKTLWIHLRMSGQLIYNCTPNNDKSVRAMIYFKEGNSLIFKDIRRFGEWILSSSNDPPMLLGPEPLDQKLDSDEFRNLFKGRNGKIHSLLMNQSILAGLGNIYVSETLFRAKVRPSRRTSSVTRSEWADIYSGMKQSLTIGLRYRGVTFRSFLNPKGKPGKMQDHLLCYGKKKQSCPRCQVPFRFIKIAGRGVTFCSQCQK